VQLESCFIDIGFVIINHAIVIRIFKHVEAKNVRLLVPCYLALPLQIFEQFFSLARPNLHFYESAINLNLIPISSVPLS